MKIISWNVNSIRARLDHVKLLIEKQDPDLMCFQETKVNDDAFPVEKFNSYDNAVYGQPAYNGVSIHARKKEKGNLEDVEVCNFRDYEGKKNARVIAGTYRKVRVINVYAPAGFSSMEHFEKKLQWLQDLHDFVSDTNRYFKHVILLGDFNIAPTKHDTFSEIDCSGGVCCTPIEREIFENFLSLGFNNTLDYRKNRGKFSWYDYRLNSFQKNRGLRLDHILVSDSLLDYVKEYRPIMGFRKLEKPSDHVPVMMVLEK